MTRLIALLTIAATAALAAAEKAELAKGNDDAYITSLIMPFGVKGRVVGSAVRADRAATVFALGCPTVTTTASPGETQQPCTFSGSKTITQGPHTWAYTETTNKGSDGRIIMKGECKLNKANTSKNTCTEIEISYNPKNKTAATTTQVGSAIFLRGAEIPVTITAGLGKLRLGHGGFGTRTGTTITATAAAATGGSGSGSAPGTTAAPTGSAGTGIGTGAGTVTSSTTASNNTSTNAAGAVIPHHGVLVGVMAAVGGAMML